jgi:predicted dehydrogenase
LATEDDVVDRVIRLTKGFGADAVIITAGSADSSVISQAMRMTRKKGRVVLVGDVGLDLKRSDFYAKELDFFISASYGPGRYDPVYEEGGQDYPIAYVRWTENRNMDAYLELVADGRIRLEKLIAPPFSIDEAASAYASFDTPTRPLIALLHYPAVDGEPARRVRNPSAKVTSDRIKVALAGASSFAQGMHLPNLRKLERDYALHAVMSRTGSNARSVADQFGAHYSTTDFTEVLNDPAVDLVLIASRHDLHGRSVVQALEAGKHVLVEKPLTLDPADLDRIAALLAGQQTPPVLMVGYNRRFSPAIVAVQNALAKRATPMIVNYRMNAGFIPRDHWVHGTEGGGRNLGEACHIYDLFNALTGTHDIRSVHACPIVSPDPQWRANDNFVATISYGDGSVCTLTYTALGTKDYPKEQMSIFCDGRVITMDDYKSVEVVGAKHKPWRSNSTQKGQLEELKALAKSLRADQHPWPISLDDLLATSRVAFEVERQLTLKSQDR